ncbi:hypothetical protein GGI07_005318 [Coemansia sp. Benny D115]|nr:hypothetical protein GGI07_005318 [Coemansia sp. Benny D115]
MKFSSPTLGSAIALAASMASMVNAHTYLSKLNIAGTQYDEGVCIRPYPANRNFPVKNPMSTDMTCGVGGVSTTASKNCPVSAGSKVTVEWHHDNDSAADDVVDGSHLGPCLVYMAPLASNGQGDVWFKIFEDGYDASSKKWCVDKIRANNGKLDITIPSDIKAGDYLLRTEVIALHEGDTDYASNSDRGAQYYPNCAQLSVTGSGSAVPKGYAIPGIYKTNSPGILFNVYSSFSSYPIPGPAVYVPGSAGPAPAPSASEYTTEAPTVEPTTEAPASQYTTEAPASEPTPAPESSSVDGYTTQEPTAPTSSAPAIPQSTVTVVVPGKCH